MYSELFLQINLGNSDCFHHADRKGAERKTEHISRTRHQDFLQKSQSQNRNIKI